MICGSANASARSLAAQSMARRVCLQVLRRALLIRSEVLVQPLLPQIVRPASDVLKQKSNWCFNSTSRELLSVSNTCRWMSSGSFPGEPPEPRQESSGFNEENDGETIPEMKPEETQERQPSALELMLEGVPRRRQRFMVQKALKLKPEGLVDERPSRRGFEMKVIDINRTVKVTKGGKVQSFAAVVVTGNYDGAIGFGKGKSAEIGPAIDKASRKALNNLHYFERYKGHTIFHEHNSKYERTKLYLWPARSGTGLRAGPTVKRILKLAGYKDVKSKVIGSRHPFNTVKAVFKTLSEIETPEEMAERRGRIVVDAHLLADS